MTYWQIYLLILCLKRHCCFNTQPQFFKLFTFKRGQVVDLRLQCLFRHKHKKRIKWYSRIRMAEYVDSRCSSNSPVTFQKQAGSNKCGRSQKTAGPRCQEYSCLAGSCNIIIFLHNSMNKNSFSAHCTTADNCLNLNYCITSVFWLESRQKHIQDTKWTSKLNHVRNLRWPLIEVAFVALWFHLW